MPIWFALYTTLQTAVEFITPSSCGLPTCRRRTGSHSAARARRCDDRPAADRASTRHGSGAQKMMTWMMPAIFTGMMLFLPAALGVYMLTNSVLGITQQLVIEKIVMRRATSPTGSAPPRRRAESTTRTTRTSATEDWLTPRRCERERLVSEEHQGAARPPRAGAIPTE